MRVFDITATAHAGKLRLQARFGWEDSNREEQDVFFEVEGAPQSLRVDANTFLLVAYPIAVAHGERRILIKETTSPLLRERLHDVYAWWLKWGMARGNEPSIDSPLANNHLLNDHGRQSVAFFSGGVDSLYMLRRNLSQFPRGNEYRIAEALFVVAHEPDATEQQLQFFSGEIAKSLSAIAAELGIGLRRVRSNVRVLDRGKDLWMKQFHGAAMAATAHAAIQERAIAHIAGTYDIHHMGPWGSHPLIDTNLGTERISILHCNTSISRLDKVRELANWPRGLSSLCVCTREIPGIYNCGTCEKCMRTKLEIAAVGAEIPSTFADRSVNASRLRIANDYQKACYEEMVGPLRERGMLDLASEVRWRMLSSGTRRCLTRFKKTARRTVKRILWRS